MRGVVEQAFGCHLCGELAATVRLLPPGVPDPEPFAVWWRGEVGMRSAFEDVWRLSIDGGPVPMAVGPVGDPVAVGAILEAGDLVALAAVDPEYANFRCPRCGVPYCKAHWADVVPETDEGFYDATYATCPRGHRVMLDD